MNQTITFCKNKCCPVLEVQGDNIVLGDANGVEGVTIWNKKQFKDFLDAAKDGKFDEVVKNI